MSGDTVPNLQENTPNFTPNDSPCRKFDEMIVMWIALPLSTILGRVRWGFRKDLGLFTDGPAILAIGYGDYRFIPRIVSSRSQPLGKCRRGDNARDTEAIECEQISLIRSEARRVGKECFSTCRSRWPPYNSNKKK